MTNITSTSMREFENYITPFEGRKNVVYYDTRRLLTVGIGHLVTPTDNFRVGDHITDAQIDALFAHDGTQALHAADAQMTAAGITSGAFLSPLASVNFQLGSRWFIEFSQTWMMIVAGRYSAAANNLITSHWNAQTPNRVRAFQAALRALPPKATL